ncbi:MAG TPA: hypothetical protein VLB80_01790 [Candidatus Babeliales bacterium]|nr:hypothetical protein [Candidatus Babeliales bacterium]
MFKHSFKTYALSIIILSINGYALPEDANKETSMTDYIAHKYIVSTLGPEQKIIINDTKPNGFSETIQKEFEAKELVLSDHEIQKIAFSLALHNRSFNTNIIDQSCIDKLEIVGNGESKTHHLIESLISDHINTTIGNAFTALTLCHPTTDTKILRNRQELISTLATHEQLITTINDSLKKINSVEKKSFIFWQEKPTKTKKH